ncbi:MAG: HNH endonuclease [Gemmatimonadetes bacterium]|nr:HNH endonuclease [Gemmatimonadota bacterium]
MRYAAKWLGFDRGREGSYEEVYWLGVLRTLANHEGESIREESSPVYTSLSQEFPETAWIGTSPDRNFFRGYQSPWTLLGVLTPTIKTKGAIHVTPLGRALLEDRVSTRAVWIQAMAELVEEDGERSFAVLASAFLDVGDQTLSFEQIYWGIEHNWRPGDGSLLAALASNSQPPDDKTTPARRLRAMLKVMVRHGLLTQTGDGWQARSPDLLSAIVHGKTIGDYPPVAVVPASTSTLPDGELATLANEADAMPMPVRERIMRAIAVRRGQPRFRRQLLALYQGRCAITQFDAAAALEAAHIVPFSVDGTHAPENGLLLRADVHTLFDLNYIGVDPASFSVVMSKRIAATKYGDLDGRSLHLPISIADYPSATHLQAHLAQLET